MINSQILENIQHNNNQQCNNASELLRIAETADDVWQALFVCNRGNRPDLLCAAISQMPLSQITINEMIEYVWMDNECGYIWQDAWDEIWHNYHSAYQNKLINRVFKQPIKLYRAGNLTGEYQSWTFSKDVAEFFAVRRRESHMIHEQYFTAEDVVAIFNDRNEKEVVIKIDF